MRYAIIENNVVTNVVLAEPAFAASQGLIACPDDAGPGWTYDDGVFTAPPAPEPSPPPVPATVSQAQLRIALHRAGLLALVQAAVDVAGDPELSIRWAASTYERASPYLNAMADQLGITEAQRDDLFRLAATL